MASERSTELKAIRPDKGKVFDPVLLGTMTNLDRDDRYTKQGRKPGQRRLRADLADANAAKWR